MATRTDGFTFLETVVLYLQRPSLLNLRCNGFIYLRRLKMLCSELLPGLYLLIRSFSLIQHAWSYIFCSELHILIVPVQVVIFCIFLLFRHFHQWFCFYVSAHRNLYVSGRRNTCFTFFMQCLPTLNHMLKTKTLFSSMGHLTRKPSIQFLSQWHPLFFLHFTEMSLKEVV